LTAPESYLLRYGDCDPRPARVFELAVKELIVRGALRLEGARVRRRLLPGERRVWLLMAGPAMNKVTEPVLEPVARNVQELLEKRPRRGIALTSGVAVEGLLVQDVARSIGKRGFDQYVHRYVAAGLQQRGLYSGIRRRTKAGREADAELDQWLAIAKRTFPAWARLPDQSRALAFAEAAGASVLLVGEAYPALAALAPRARIQDLADPAPAVWLDSGGSDGGWVDALGLSFLDSSLDALSQLDSLLGGIDGGAGGGDGGGDGGSG
jgi:hypothetical protein